MSATADPTLAALLAAVRANPADDLPRLVCADWYEEHGQPERGEFIRVQCELARLRELGCHEGETCNVTGPCSECHRGVDAERLKVREQYLLHATGYPPPDVPTGWWTATALYDDTPPLTSSTAAGSATWSCAPPTSGSGTATRSSPPTRSPGCG